MKSKIVLLILMLISPFVWSHKSSDSFMNLQLNNENVTGQWDIALRDLDYALGLDYDGNGEITWQARHCSLFWILGRPIPECKKVSSE